MSYASVAAAALCCGVLGLRILYMFQLEGYLVRETLAWTFKNPARVYFRAGFACALAVSLLCAWEALPPAGALTASLAALVSCVLDSAHHTAGKHLKKKLNYTKRFLRLLAAHALVSLALTALCVFEPYLLPVFATLYPAAALCAGWIIAPYERRVNRNLFNDAKRIIASRPDLIRIGITGSYGKTSTKFILATILSEKYNVLATPSSFNTPMGLTRVIREQLSPENEVFIAEMGARRVGEIAELAELVKPALGAITSVGKQHLETFLTLENIINTKYELIEALPPDGSAFFADDGGIVRAMYDRTRGAKFISGFDHGCDIYADEISVGPSGSSFRLVRGGQSVRCVTPLLGRHNISNVLLCASMSLSLGMTLDEVSRGIVKLKPVEHRLQLIKGAGGLTVIDDAFNSNPAGAKAALDVISAFPGRRVIITPGMVELGAQEADLNREFGRQMARAVDSAILIGEKRTRPILEGLLESGFSKESVFIAESLDEATKAISRFAGAGDVVLFENDLPDNY